LFDLLPLHPEGDEINNKSHRYSNYVNWQSFLAFQFAYRFHDYAAENGGGQGGYLSVLRFLLPETPRKNVSEHQAQAGCAQAEEV
jgi:hypothetical protein